MIHDVFVVVGTFFICLAVITALKLIWRAIGWSASNQLVKSRYPWGLATYDQFERRFNRYEWRMDGDSLDPVLKDGKPVMFEYTYIICKDMFIFEKRGMILGFWDYLKARKLIENKIQSLEKHESGLWVEKPNLRVVK